MNTIIGTYALQFATVRYYAGSDDDIALTLACNQLVVAGYVLEKTAANVVGANTNQYYLYWTRPEEGGLPPDEFNPDDVPNVTWVNAAPVIP
jgi:hypothetical protein